MTELEQLKNDLVKIQERINKLENPTFEVGKWYKMIEKDNHALFYITKINNKFDSSGFGFDRLGYWFGHSDYWNIKNITPATDKEVEEALIKEAIKRGVKEGVEYKPVNYHEIVEVGNGSFVYDKSENKLLYYGWACFKDGKWAEIIKEEPIKIGGVDCVVDSCGAWFDKNQYSWEEINSLVKVFKNHSSQLKSINVGCSGQYKVDLELLEKILALKK